MKISILKCCAIIAAFAVPGIAVAANNVTLSSDVFVERKIEKSDGKTAIVLEQPKTVLPGDNLVFVVKYKNVGNAPATDFSVTNPLPEAVTFNGTSDGNEIVSVDGGKNWGPLSALTFKRKNGEVRPALLSDVTHIKWKFNRSLLKNKEYLIKINEVIATEKLFYAACVYNPQDICLIPDEELQFTIDDDLFLENLLAKIRGQTIRFSSRIKKELSQKTKDIEKQIDVLERDLNEQNLDLLAKKKAIWKILGKLS